VYTISGSIEEFAMSVMAPPVSQNRGVDELIIIEGGPTVILACEAHPSAFVPVTVYVVKVEAVELTTAPVVLFSVGDAFQT
jgi:hypothetical protein